MNTISQSVQVILAIDLTVQGNNGTQRIPRYGCLNHQLSTSVFHCGKKAVRVVSCPGLTPHINSPCSWEKRKTGLVGEYHLLPLVCRPALVISTPLQTDLNANSRKKRFLDGGSFIISGFIKFTANSFCRNWTIQMLIQLSSHFGGSSPMISSHNAFNERRSLSVSLKVRPKLLWLIVGFSVLPEFCQGP